MCWEVCAVAAPKEGDAHTHGCQLQLQLQLQREALGRPRETEGVVQCDLATQQGSLGKRGARRETEVEVQAEMQAGTEAGAEAVGA